MAHHTENGADVVLSGRQARNVTSCGLPDAVGEADVDNAGVSLFRSRSLYDHVRGHLRSNRPGLTEGGERLPDEGEPVDGLRWAPGARDGVFRHIAVGEPAEGVEELFEAIVAAVDSSRAGPAYLR